MRGRSSTAVLILSALSLAPSQAQLEPLPLPDDARADLFFSEPIWNRGDGAVFVTEGMAKGTEMPQEPPR